MRTSEVGWVCPFCGSSELDNGDFIHNHFVRYNCIDIKLNMNKNYILNLFYNF